MTRKEEIKKESLIFSEREAHGHHYRDLTGGFEAGAQWADRTMIEKACEWLKENAYLYIYIDFDEGDVKEVKLDIDDLSETFKNYMKGE
jgi:hypothetical protein